MKVLLLEHPRKIARVRCNDIANTPLSSCLISGYAAGLLSGRGHEVKIIEGYLEGLSYGEIHRAVSNFGPDLLGVHMVYQWEREEDLFAFLGELKGAGKTPFIAAYGFYPTFAYEEILRHSQAIEAVIMGEPELTLARLAERHAGAGLQEIPGLAWRNRSGICIQPREPEPNLDKLPFPVRTEAMLRLPEINIEGSRGCYGGCTFCYINAYYGMGTHQTRNGDTPAEARVLLLRQECPRSGTGFGGRRNVPDFSRWRGRSPENIIAEIDRLLAEYGKRDFYFVDPNFFGPGQYGQDRALRLASLLKERHIHFGIEARVNDIHERTVSSLAEAGLRHMLVGLESGRDESLKRLNKMTTVAQNEKALKILRQYGIEPNVGFIMFEPDSSLQDIRANYEFLQRNALTGDLAITANVLYHPMIILQGTRAYHKLQEEGRLKLLSTTYEGTAGFADRQVAALASIMSGITNYLFVRMDGVWSGKAKEPKGAQLIYDHLNRSLLSYFEDTLARLESGKQLAPEEIEALVCKAKQEIENNFSGTD
ncbi:MAG: radical SAM protein [Peptococcaceae bacterium BICA1-7]|nr:MAG: radical SAM protein [Peptococcaceae bacterium BICA1-7]HBV99176.1 B12-binding domain-containing radical SAM protein [Desulfotomaculum sp.]